MQFYEAGRFVFLGLIPFVLLVFLQGRVEWKKRVSLLGNPTMLQQRLMPGFSTHRMRASWLLLVLVFLFSTLALARPQWGEEKKRVERKGVDILFLLDTSLSMLAEDVKSSRLAKSKLEIKNIIRKLEGDRVGMVAFAGSSFLQCPLTLDYSAFLIFVDALKPGYIPDPGTSLAQAIELGIRAFPEENKKYRAMIVFSDGEDHEGGMEGTLQKAKKAGVRIYSIGAGTAQGEPIPLRAAADQRISGYKKDQSGQVVVTKLNAELLDRIAKETGALYLPATSSEKEVDVILKDLESLGEGGLKERLITEREDHFQAFLFLAFLFLMIETFLRRTATHTLSRLTLSLFCLITLCAFIDTPRSLVQKGNRQVGEKKYQSAVESYRKAQVARPKEPVIRYNLGTALHRLFEYRDAEKEFEQSLAVAKEPSLKANILYNYGNTKYRLGDFEKAIEAYKKVLEIDPKDKDAKYNLEFLKQKKAQFEDKQKERQEQQQEKPQPRQSQQDQQQSQKTPQAQGTDQQKGSSQDQQKEQEQKEGKGQKQEGAQAEKEEDEQEQGKEQQGGPKMGQQGEEEKEEASTGSRGQQQKEQQKEKGEDKEDKQKEGAAGMQEQEKSGQGEAQSELPLQGQMGQENAIRILDALREGDRQLQDLRRPPLKPGSKEVAKDW